MRLISLNLWGGKEFDSLMDFLEKASAKTDIFCFQEVFRAKSRDKIRDGYCLNLYSELKRRLTDFRGYMAVSEERCAYNGPVDFPCDFGLAMFVRKLYTVRSHESFPIGVTRKAMPWKRDGWKEIAQCVTTEVGGRPYIFCNVHGIADWPKTDTPDRLRQSRRIIAVLRAFEGRKIACGDFNLDPESESVLMFEEAGMKNLVKDYQIKTTRSSLFYELRPDAEDKISDYVFVSPDINVKKFAVPNVAVSDHLPFILDFS